MKKYLIILWIILLLSISLNIFLILENKNLSKIWTQSEAIGDFDKTTSYKLTPRDKCLIPVFWHPAFSYFWNRESSVYDLLKIEDKEGYLYNCDWAEKEKSTLEFILTEPIENTKLKPREDYFNPKIFWKWWVLTDIYYYLEKHKNDFSKENLEKIKSILKNSKNLVINENPKDSEIYKKLYEILEIKGSLFLIIV